MKYLNVIMVVALSLFGFFTTTTDGLTCYKCSWKDEKCATEKDDSKLTSVSCTAELSKATTAAGAAGAGGAAGGAAEVTTAAAAAALQSEGNANVHKHKTPLRGFADPTFHCFKINVKANATAPVGVERGCKATSATTDCLPSDGVSVYETCEVCDKDNCNGNGQSMVTGSAVRYALLSCLVVARMFLHAK